jgi:hypothetical protein
MVSHDSFFVILGLWYCGGRGGTEGKRRDRGRVARKEEREKEEGQWGTCGERGGWGGMGGVGCAERMSVVASDGTSHIHTYIHTYGMRIRHSNTAFAHLVVDGKEGELVCILCCVLKHLYPQNIANENNSSSSSSSRK